MGNDTEMVDQSMNPKFSGAFHEYLNINGFYTHLLQHLAHMTDEGFLKPYHRDRVLVAKEPAELLQLMKAQRIEYIDKWWKT